MKPTYVAEEIVCEEMEDVEEYVTDADMEGEVIEEEVEELIKSWKRWELVLVS